MGRCYHQRMAPDRILLILVIVLIIVIVWRGPKTLPLIGRAFGQGVKEARKELDGMKADMAPKDGDEAPAGGGAVPPGGGPNPADGATPTDRGKPA